MRGRPEHDGQDAQNQHGAVRDDERARRRGGDGDEEDEERRAEEANGTDPDRWQLHDRHPCVEPAAEQAQRREGEQHLMDEHVLPQVAEGACGQPDVRSATVRGGPALLGNRGRDVGRTLSDLCVQTHELAL